MLLQLAFGGPCRSKLSSSCSHGKHSPSQPLLQPSSHSFRGKSISISSWSSQPPPSLNPPQCLVSTDDFTSYFKGIKVIRRGSQQVLNPPDTYSVVFFGRLFQQINLILWLVLALLYNLFYILPPACLYIKIISTGKLPCSDIS